VRIHNNLSSRNLPASRAKNGQGWRIDHGTNTKPGMCCDL
jgi:hypothetical protein